MKRNQKPLWASGIVLLMLLGTITVIRGQAPGPRGPRGGFGQGGPGGDRPMSLLQLLEIPEVRDELKIRDDQRPQLDQLSEALRSEIRAAYDLDFRQLFDLPENERQAKFDEARKKVETATHEQENKLDELLSAEQSRRLRQVQLQIAGPEAFHRPDVSEALKLSETQAAKIREVAESARPRFEFGPPDREQVEAARRKAVDGAVASLDEAQRAKWRELTGEPFDLPPPGPEAFGREGFAGGFGPGGPRGRGPGGPGGPMGGPTREVMKQFDHNGDGWLNQAERAEARKTIPAEQRGGPPRGPGGPPGGPGRGNREAPRAGVKVSPSEVAVYPDAPLYDTAVLRTLFLDFENDDWEAELEAFHNTDVDVPATLTVDGKQYPRVGVRFRGMSSYGMVPAGYKRSFNVAMDLADEGQRLHGYKTLNLLNCNGDPSFMSSVLYSQIANQFLPAPKANFIKVVVNGESWGVYANVQQFDKVFLKEHYKSSKGTRWKVSGSPGGDGGLRYLGEELDEYKRRFEMKSADGDKAWKRLVELCRVLEQTPADQLVQMLEPLLDIDETLRFLALDVALVNSDGYWTRASDYSLFLDAKGQFHVIPHDMNEAFHTGGGPGGGGPPPGFGPPGGPGFGPPGGGFGPPPGGRDGFGPPPDGFGPPPDGFGPPPDGLGPPRGGPSDPRRAGRPGRGGRPGGPGGGFGPNHGGVDLDPLVSIDNPRMPLRGRLLGVPELREKYLKYVREIATQSLDWNRLGPAVAKYRQLIADEVEADTRKLLGFDEFERATSGEPDGGGRSLRAFADQRRKFLLEYQPAKISAGRE